MSQAFHNATNSPHDAAKFPRTPQPARGIQLATEGRIEARLHDLGDEIQELTEAPYPGLLQERGYVREAYRKSARA